MLEAEKENYWQTLVQQLPGGESILQGMNNSLITGAPKSQSSDQPCTVPVVYLISDSNWDESAHLLLKYNQISSLPEVNKQSKSLVFECYSSQTLAFNPSPVVYHQTLWPSGFANCTCLDFQCYGGACKHLQAALLQLDISQITHKINYPHITLSISEEDALILYTQHHPLISADPPTSILNPTSAQYDSPFSNSLDPILKPCHRPVALAAQAIEDFLSVTVGNDNEEGGDSDTKIAVDEDESLHMGGSLSISGGEGDVNKWTSLEEYSSDAADSSDNNFSLLLQKDHSSKAAVHKQTSS